MISNHSNSAHETACAMPYTAALQNMTNFIGQRVHTDVADRPKDVCHCVRLGAACSTKHTAYNFRPAVSIITRH